MQQLFENKKRKRNVLAIHAEIDAKEDARIDRCLKKTQYGSRANLLRILVSEALAARGF